MTDTATIAPSADALLTLPRCGAMTVEEILRVLPHRYPFLLVDAVREFEPGVRILALKCVTAGEWFFAGVARGVMHMPGLLIVEALAQAGGILLLSGAEDAATKVVYFASMDHVRWHEMVVPGDQLRLHVTVTHARGRLRRVHAEALVGTVVVCEADMSAVVMDR